MLQETENRKRMREKWTRNSVEFNACQEFIKNPEPLSSEMQRLMIVMGAKPIQAVFYDTVIYHMTDDSREALRDAAAELYYLQRELNRKIGRTVYHKGSIDRTLLGHIYNEITARLPELAIYPCDEVYEQEAYERFLLCYGGTGRMVTSVRALTESLLDHYQGREQISYQELKEYLESVTPGVDYAAPDMTFEKYLKMCFDRNRIRKEDANSEICSEDRYKKLLDITRNASFFKRFPNKDELYTLCIALSVSYDDFIILRQCIEREMKDSATYADNDYSSRDTKIQSVIRDIDDWYASVKKKYPKIMVEQQPKMVLIEVNKMLEENGYAPVYRGKNGGV